MKHFLKSVAKFYTDKYIDKDISRLTFVLPNKRSGTFLLRYFREASFGRPVIAPEILSISDFVARNVSSVPDSRLDLLFRLYSCYVNLPGADSELSFEKFSSWGETLLNDFNEVDMQMANAEELFKNVSDLNSIRSDFLTDEQKEVMVEYFGANPSAFEDNLKRFWKSFGDDSKDDEGSDPGVRKKFKALWQLMYPLYESFRKNLSEDGFATSGGAYRELAESLEDGKPLRDENKIVFVGFNALAESERRIFKALKAMKVVVGGGEEPKADFIWESVVKLLDLDEKDDPALKFVRLNALRFPAPEDFVARFNPVGRNELPSIEVVAVPSNVMQVKIASMKLKEFASRKGAGEKIQEARVAVVLPDENLLLPFLYSLPTDKEGESKFANPNLTMGQPLRHTPVISFMRLLKKLHQRSRMAHGEPVFFFEDVRDILSHPYSRLLFNDVKISEFIQLNTDTKQITVSMSRLESLGKENALLLFRFFPEGASPLDVLDYIYRLLIKVEECFGPGEEEKLRRQIEITYISTYLDAVTRISNSLREYPSIAVSAVGMFNLAERLLAGETVSFEGEPLQGLQVMGLLETRCLDFDQVIVLSVNEKTLPRVGKNNSFIPNVLRETFGMPPANYQEEIFAYYFYRLIGASSHAVLTYDSRTSDVRSGGPSRYLLQLRYFPSHEGLSLKETEFALEGKKGELKEIIINKEQDFQPLLESYIVGPDEVEQEVPDKSHRKLRKFSASNISHYNQCSLKFLYNDLLRIAPQREKIESIDAIDMGTIIHDAIEHLYLPNNNKKLLEKPKVLSESDLKAILHGKNAKGEPLVDEAVRRAILKTHFHVTEDKDLDSGKLRGSAAIIQENIVSLVEDVVKEDIKLAPVLLWGCEIEKMIFWTLPDGRKVRMKMVIDRLDQVGNDKNAPFRIIDYKTGTAHMEADSLEELFNDDYRTNYPFQLILYAELLLERFPELGVSREDFERNLQLLIYHLPKLAEGKGRIHPKIAGKDIMSFSDLRDLEAACGVTYKDLLNSKIIEILDPSQAFRGTITEDSCSKCDFRLLCEIRATT